MLLAILSANFNGQSMSTSYKHFTPATNVYLTAGADLGFLKRVSDV